MEAYLATLHRTQLERLADRIYRRMCAGGGTSFGIDRTTMNVVHPGLMRAYDATVLALLDRYKPAVPDVR